MRIRPVPSLVSKDRSLRGCPGILSWLETTEWFDCRGPNDTADWLGIDRDTKGKLNSPIDVTLLQSFAKRTEHHPGEILWEICVGSVRNW